MRRTLILATAASGVLLGGGVVPLLGTATAAACPAWTDAPGDTGAHFATVEGVPVSAPIPDETVDITGVRVETSATGIVATFTVPKLADVNETTYGDRFLVRLDVGGTIASAFTDRDDLDTNERTGIIVGGAAYTGGSAKYDVAGKKVVLTMPNSAFDAALKKPFAGLDYTIVRADVVAQAGSKDALGASASTHTMDTAPAPENTKLKGGVACGTPVTVPTKLTLSVAKTGSLRTVTAKLTTTAGQPIAAKPVTFYLNGKKGSTVRTASNGTAVLKNVKAGVTVKAVFVAGSGYLGSTATKKT